MLTHDPAIVAIGVENHADLSFKDAARNMRETEGFTVNMLDDALAAAMEICAIQFGPEVDALAEAGLTAVPGTHVASPRILQSPASLECRRYMALEVGRARDHSGSGGGIPAVLHPNEAVIPLSRGGLPGRKVPVEVSGGKGGSSGGAAFTITNNVSVEGGSGGGGDAAMQARLAGHIANTVSLKIRESMADQMRYGGMMNPRGR